MRLPLIFALLLVAASAQAVSYPPELLNEHVEAPGNGAAKFKEPYEAAISPAIPKSWRLVAVTGGDLPNSSRLWFQDSDGSVYLLQGGLVQNKLVMQENVYKIPAQ